MHAAPLAKPLLSLVIEGYNESLALGQARTSIDALLSQDFPLEQVEVLLVGAEREARRWAEIDDAVRSRFHAFRVIGRDDTHYYALKNLGGELAEGEIVVFLDSDTLPEPGWLQAIVQGMTSGADAQAGMTSFVGENGCSVEHPVLAAAASISWGFLVPAPGGRQARGFLSHNFAIRADLFRSIRYRSDLGRTCAGHFLGRALREHGVKIAFNPAQRVAHVFVMQWWLMRLHVRFGHEVYLLRRLDPGLRHQWIMKLSWLEPMLVGAWHMCLDIPQWRRYAIARGIPLTRRLLWLPLVAALSVLARSAEVGGMYATMLNPRRMRRFALSN
jgi:hypothetical protein